LTTSRARAMESGLPPPANVTTGRSSRASTALTERMRRSTLRLLCEGLHARTGVGDCVAIGHHTGEGGC
jgi:hypothetical protein